MAFSFKRLGAVLWQNDISALFSFELLLLSTRVSALLLIDHFLTFNVVGFSFGIYLCLISY
ncbi:hypothetical protein QAY67_03370 [Staphylococcus aureus]